MATSGRYAILDADIRCGSCGESKWTFYLVSPNGRHTDDVDAQDDAHNDAEDDSQKELVCSTCAGLGE